MPTSEVVAAGTVVLRKGRVLLVHRKRYDDWAFPKGKLDRAESAAAAAVRETEEETGLRTRLAVPLPSVSYALRNGRTKTVHYWLARVRGHDDVSSYEPNREIDAVDWVPVAKAPRRLTYDHDRETFQTALGLPRRTWPLVVLRHAHARDRKSWRHDDRLRPLMYAGALRAERLAPMLDAFGVTRVVTSTSARCLASVTPYIAVTGLGVTTDLGLSEEAATTDTVRAAVGDLLERQEGSVLCTHRPVLPEVFAALGLHPVRLEPGGFMVVHHARGEVVATELHQP
jgi:8-oxo-dGTP diphosphatase